MAAKVVFDTSAILALVKAELGWHKAAAVFPSAVLCTVNAAEVYTKFAEWQLPRHEQAKYQVMIEEIVVPFDHDLALRAGAFRSEIRQFGLSLGDRACLALAHRLGVRAMTTEKIWANLQIGVEIEVIR
jgi:ribonuclease VapC